MPYDNCMDCPNHKVIADPDPDDWFCDDDKAIVCTITKNLNKNESSRHKSERQEHKVVMCAIRPYNLRKEGDAPDWCPLKTAAQPTAVS